MSIRICVSYETDRERDEIDAALQALQPWKISDAPSKGQYSRRYYRISLPHGSEKIFRPPLTTPEAACYNPLTPAAYAGESEVPRQQPLTDC